MSATSPLEVPSVEDMREALRKAKDPVEVSQKVLMCVYGKPKRGKTRFAGTFPKPLILDFDQGAGVLAGVKGFNGKVVTVESWDDVQMWYWILRTQKHPFQTVVWDTVTMAQELALREVLGNRAQERKGTDPYKATMDDYGRSGRILRTWLGMFAQLPLHVVFVCHERDDDAPDEEEGESVVRWLVPDLQAMVRGYLLGLVSTIGYAYKVIKDGKVSFRLGFDRPGTVAADRYGRLPKAVKEPTFDKIMKYYNGGDSSEQSSTAV